MEKVGHVDPKTTLKVYTLLTKKMKIKSMKNVTLQHNEKLDKLTL